MDVVELVGPASRPRRAGRADTVSTLFRVHHRRLVGLAMLLVDDRQTAEDVVQDAFVGLHRRWRHLRDPGSAVAYLNRAVVNGARDQLRRRGRANARALRLVPQSEERDSAESAAVAHDEADRIWSAVSALPRRQREVLVLRYYLDQSEADIAETLQVSPGSVKKHASRALVALARSLESGT